MVVGCCLKFVVFLQVTGLGYICFRVILAQADVVAFPSHRRVFRGLENCRALQH